MTDAQTYQLIGAAMKVHRTLGPGFLERAYQEALSLELRNREVPHETEVAVPIHYEGVQLETVYRADLVAWGEVLLELKAIAGLADRDEAQLVHYLRATGLHRGLLLNFGTPRLQVRRLAVGYDDRDRGASCIAPPEAVGPMEPRRR